MEELKLFTTDETAKILRISKRTLGRYKKARQIKPKTIGNKDLYTFEEIDKFINRR
ncbi:helix-turn-helix domain-containing protein [Clostridium manihotivorum]|uniref:helix-turn-helix domain-containing protein n=1 Tax=Clostridium manihotivorum TaxID=2320868 RepID=UPI0013E2AAD9|nr:helix-turn-helix domain-containing protein [Clostridium manihotivorum]